MPDTQEQTYWNGEPCAAERVMVVVDDDQRFPEYWARRFVGTQRRAVKITYSGNTFYIDDEGYEQTQGEIDLLRSHGFKAEKVAGYPGWGWDKVTVYRGSSKAPHAGLAIQREVDDEQAEALDESQRDRKAAEDAQAKAEGLQPPARAGDDG